MVVLLTLLLSLLICHHFHYLYSYSSKLAYLQLLPGFQFPLRDNLSLATLQNSLHHNNL